MESFHAEVNARGTRRRWGSYQASLEQRAVAAAIEVNQHGWSRRQAAALFGVNAAYVGLVAGFDERTCCRLVDGELTLAELWRGYVRSLAERQAVRQQTAQVDQPQLVRTELPKPSNANGGSPLALPDTIVDRIIAKIGLDRIMRALDRATRPSHG
jgi:hypothetical protein